MKTTSSIKKNNDSRIRESDASTAPVSQTISKISRGKDLSSIVKTIKKQKHRGGLSHRMDLHFEDVKAILKKNTVLLTSVSTELNEFKIKVKNDIAEIKSTLEKIQSDIKKVSYEYSSYTSEDETESDIEMKNQSIGNKDNLMPKK